MRLVLVRHLGRHQPQNKGPLWFAVADVLAVVADAAVAIGPTALPAVVAALATAVAVDFATVAGCYTLQCATLHRLVGTQTFF